MLSTPAGARRQPLIVAVLPNVLLLYNLQEHDVGHYDVRSSVATLFVVRLLCRTEEMLSLLVQQIEDQAGRGGENEAQPSAPSLASSSSLSRLRCSASTVAELRRSRSAIRAPIQGNALPMLEAWFTRALRDHQVGRESVLLRAPRPRRRFFRLGVLTPSPLVILPGGRCVLRSRSPRSPLPPLPCPPPARRDDDPLRLGLSHHKLRRVSSIRAQRRGSEDHPTRKGGGAERGFGGCGDAGAPATDDSSSRGDGDVPQAPTGGAGLAEKSGNPTGVPGDG